MYVIFLFCGFYLVSVGLVTVRLMLCLWDLTTGRFMLCLWVWQLGDICCVCGFDICEIYGLSVGLNKISNVSVSF